MSLSRQEELIGVLWLIAALIAFDSGHSVFGWLFTFKATVDLILSIISAVSKLNGESEHE